jgi:hypothetical protein
MDHTSHRFIVFPTTVFSKNTVQTLYFHQHIKYRYPSQTDLPLLLRMYQSLLLYLFVIYQTAHLQTIQGLSFLYQGLQKPFSQSQILLV